MRQEHMAGLFSGAGGVLFVRPGLRLWSLTRGSVKYSRGDTGHGGGLGWTASSCELLHLQAVLLCTIVTTGRDDHARSCHFFPHQVKSHRCVSAESGAYDGTRWKGHGVGDHHGLSVCSCETPLSPITFLCCCCCRHPSAFALMGKKRLFRRLEEVLVMGMRLTEGISHKVSYSPKVTVMFRSRGEGRRQRFCVYFLQHWALFSPQLGLRDVFGASMDVRDFLKSGRLILDHR